MVNRGLSTLACEYWNRRRARKKQAVAISTGRIQHRTVESREHTETLKDNMVIQCIRTYPQSYWLVLPLDQAGLDERVRPTICATPHHFNQSHAQVITSPTSSSYSLPTESSKSCGDGNWRTSKYGCTHAAATNLHTDGLCHMVVSSVDRGISEIRQPPKCTSSPL